MPTPPTLIKLCFSLYKVLIAELKLETGCFLLPPNFYENNRQTQIYRVILHDCLPQDSNGNCLFKQPTFTMSPLSQALQADMLIVCRLLQIKQLSFTIQIPDTK